MLPSVRVLRHRKCWFHRHIYSAVIVGSTQADAMTATGPKYSRDCLFLFYSTATPTLAVQQRLRELGIWTVCRLSTRHHRSVAFLRRYRGCRSGRSRLIAPCCQSANNIRRPSPSSVVFGSLNVRSLNCNVSGFPPFFASYEEKC